MTTTCSRVEIIQQMFNLLVGEASLENRVDPTSIQGIIQDKIVFCVVTDAVTIIARYMQLKMLGLEINQQISIPRISSANQEQKFIWK